MFYGDKTLSIMYHLGANLIIIGYDEDKLRVAVLNKDGIRGEEHYSVLPTDLVLRQ